MPYLNSTVLTLTTGIWVGGVRDSGKPPLITTIIGIVAHGASRHTASFGGDRATINYMCLVHGSRKSNCQDRMV